MWVCSEPTTIIFIIIIIIINIVITIIVIIIIIIIIIIINYFLLIFADSAEIQNIFLVFVFKNEYEFEHEFACGDN